MLKPVARFCIRHSIKLQDLIECCKIEFVDEAKRELQNSSAKINHSRLSVLTGLHRRDIVRLDRGEVKLERPTGLLTRIIGEWHKHKDFSTAAGAPRVLSVGSDQSDFSKLVRRVSKELNPAAVLFELERVGAVERTGSRVKLQVEAYVPKGDIVAGFKIYSDDSCDLLEAVQENVLSDPEIPNLHSRTVYDRVRTEGLEEIKSWLLKEGHALHEKARALLSKHDQDVSPIPSYKGKFAKIALSSFSKVSLEGERK